MKNNLTYFKGNISNLLFWVVSFVLFLPVIVLPPNFAPSDWTRSILFRIIVTGLVSYLLFKFFYKKDLSISVPKLKNPVFLPIVALLGLFAALIVSTIFSQDIRFSIFGSPTRSGGLLNLLFLFIFAIILGFFIEKEHLGKLLRLNFLVGVLISIVAFIQYFGFLNNIFIKWEAGGPPSFLGNSTFLAIYMLFLVFSSIAFFLSEKNKGKKIYYGVLFLIFVFTILISGSRATYLGMLIAFTFYFLFLPIKSVKADTEQFKWLNVKNLKILKVISVIFISLILFGLIYVNISAKLPNFIENNTRVSYFVHNRLSIESVLKDLAGTRLSAWTITMQAIKDNPLLGWGPENSYIGFEKYYDPTLPPSLQKLWWDRPHNIFLEIWTTSGIFALVLYSVFWIVIIWQLQKFKNKSEDNKNIFAAHSLQAMFIGYLVVLSFQFNSFATYLISFFFIGYSFFLISTLGEKIEVFAPQKNIFSKKIIITIFTVFSILFLWFWNIKPLYLNEKITYVKNLQCKKALEALDKAKWENYGIIKPYAILKYSDILKSCAYAEPSKEVEYSRKALSLLKIASDIQPKFTRTWLFMGSFANILAAREENAENKNKLLEEAKGYLNKAMELSPKRQEIFIEMSKLFLIAEDYKSMKQIGQDCVKIDQTNSACYWYLGVSEIFLGEQEEGKKNIETSKEKGYLNPTYKQLAVAYMSQKNWKDAVKAYELITPPSAEKFPYEAASHYSALAYLYNQNGDYEKAGESAFKVFKLQPNNPETVQFIRLLLGFKPNSAELHYYLADIYKKIGEIEKYSRELSAVEGIYSKLISQNPNKANYRFDFANIYKKLGEEEKAVDQLVLIVKLYPNRKNDAEDIVRSMGGVPWAIYEIKMGLTK